MRLNYEFKIAEFFLDHVPLTLGSLRKEIALRMSSCRSGLAMTVEIQIRMSSANDHFETPLPNRREILPDFFFES